MSLEQQLNDILNQRQHEGLLRQLFVDDKGIDFLSNDYLGFARLIKVETDPEEKPAQGSRLLGGNTQLIEDLEDYIAGFHGFEAALLYNSGYAANLGLFSCLLTRHDTYIYDEYIHASVRDGMRLSLARSFSFLHNSVEDLEEKLKHATGKIVVAVEAVYSMDGDSAPLAKILECCKKYGAELIVDEAHSVGVLGKQGRGMVCAEGLEKDVFAAVYTYGKAMGCHGAVVAGSKVLESFLVNFSRPFIYTTAPSVYQVDAVRTAYSLLQSSAHEKNILSLRKNILFFAETMSAHFPGTQIQQSHINKFSVGNLHKTVQLAASLRNQGYICRPVLSPTVEKGQERIRINLHAYNTLEEITGLIMTCKKLLV